MDVFILLEPTMDKCVVALSDSKIGNLFKKYVHSKID